MDANSAQRVCVPSAVWAQVPAGEKAVLKELSKLVREAVNLKRVTWKADHKPEWWPENSEMDVPTSFLATSVFRIPEFSQESKNSWSLTDMQALLALAISGSEQTLTWVDVVAPSEVTKPCSLPNPPLSEIKQSGGAEAEAISSQEHESNTDADKKSRRRSPDHFKAPSSKRQFVEPSEKQLQMNEVVENIVEELDIEVDARCSELRVLAQNAAFSLKNAYRVQLMRLPKRVRSLPLSRFLDEYGDQLDSSLFEGMQNAVNSHSIKESVRSKSRSTFRHDVVETSMGRSTTNSVPNWKLVDDVQSNDKENTAPRRTNGGRKSFSGKKQPNAKRGLNDPQGKTQNAKKLEQLQQLAALQRQVANMIASLNE